MKKIRLDPGDLRVESFVTGDAVGSEPGTVFQMANTQCDHTCDGALPTCVGGQNCDGESDGCDWTNLDAISCTGGGTTGPSFPTAPGHGGCTEGCTYLTDCEEEGTEDIGECGGDDPESGGF